MPYITDINQHSLKVKAMYPNDSTPAAAELNSFYADWKDSNSEIYAFSSGSTGTPKKIFLNKEYMMQSAAMTLSYLNIPEGATSLLCMPLRFIGAKMVVVRALVGSLNLILTEPSSAPLRDLDEAPYFAAMTPQQVLGCTQSEHDFELLRNIKELIIGGVAVDKTLLDKIKDFPNHIYSTYGMTETLSHVALMRLNVKEKTGFVPFDGVELSVSDLGALTITCSRIGVHNLKTNDIVTFNDDGSFELLGRLDNVINSGGIKIQIEQLEEKLKEYIKAPFNVSFVPDSVLGQKCVLICETSVSSDLIKVIHDRMPKYEAPKLYFKADALPKTLSGKPDRKALKELAFKLHQQMNLTKE